MQAIKVRYSAVDGFAKTRTFKTLAGARRFAQSYVGEFPSIGTGYAVSDDGVGKVTVEGATLRELFTAEAAPNPVKRDAGWRHDDLACYGPMDLEGIDDAQRDEADRQAMQAQCFPVRGEG